MPFYYCCGTCCLRSVSCCMLSSLWFPFPYFIQVANVRAIRLPGIYNPTTYKPASDTLQRRYEHIDMFKLAQMPMLPCMLVCYIFVYLRRASSTHTTNKRVRVWYTRRNMNCVKARLSLTSPATLGVYPRPDTGRCSQQWPDAWVCGEPCHRSSPHYPGHNAPFRA